MPARLLAAVLQGVQPEGGQRGGVRVAEDAEDAALLVELVVVEGQRGQSCMRLIDAGPLVRSGSHCGWSMPLSAVLDQLVDAACCARCR